MQVNASSMRLPCEEMTKLRSLCTKYDIIFSRSSKEMGFYDRIYHKTKLKKDALPFRRTCGSMSFEKIKATKKLQKLQNSNMRKITKTLESHVGKTLKKIQDYSKATLTIIQNLGINLILICK